MMSPIHQSAGRLCPQSKATRWAAQPMLQMTLISSIRTTCIVRKEPASMGELFLRNRSKFLALATAGVILCLLALRAHTIPTQQEQAKVVRTERIEIVDRTGKVRARFGLDDAGNTQLVLNDRE